LDDRPEEIRVLSKFFFPQVVWLLPFSFYYPLALPQA
jgi:hypothetical protein